MAQDFGTQIGRRAGIQLVFMGVLFLVVAVGLVVFLGGDSLASGTVVPLAGLFGLIGLVEAGVGVLLMRRAGGRAQVAVAGTPGTARILGLTQTGMSLNDQPQIGMDLEVTAAGLGTYQVEHKEFVPFLLLSRLQVGATMAVRVNPSNPKQIVILWNEVPARMPQAGVGAPGAAGAGTAAATAVAGSGASESLGQVAAAMQASGLAGSIAPVFGTSEQANYSVDQLRTWLRTNGVAAMARIDRLEDSGQSVGTDRLMTMQTTIEVPGRPPFQTAPSAAMVPIGKLARVAVGVTLPVLMAPDNPDVLMFEWDKI